MTIVQAPPPTAPVMVLRNAGSSSPPDRASIAVVRDRMETSAATRLTAYVADRTGLLWRRALTTLTAATITA